MDTYELAFRFCNDPKSINDEDLGLLYAFSTEHVFQAMERLFAVNLELYRRGHKLSFLAIDWPGILEGLDEARQKISKRPSYPFKTWSQTPTKKEEEN